MAKQHKAQLGALNSAFEELARNFEARRQALTHILTRKFENERNMLEEKVIKQLQKSEKEISQADNALTQIKSAVKSNS